jgi:hypothetical protein
MVGGREGFRKKVDQEFGEKFLRGSKGARKAVTSTPEGGS